MSVLSTLVAAGEREWSGICVDATCGEKGPIMLWAQGGRQGRRVEAPAVARMSSEQGHGAAASNAGRTGQKGRCRVLQARARRTRAHKVEQIFEGHSRGCGWV